MQPEQQPVMWTVGKQTRVSQFDNGQAVPGVNVPVNLSSGETFTLFVPDEQYRLGLEHVRSLIQAEVDYHVGVGGLTGTAG